MDLIDFIIVSNRCKTVEELTGNFLRFLKEFGYDRFIFSDFGHSRLEDREKNHGILVNYPAEWMARYMDQHYVEIDPVYKKMTIARKPYTWTEAKATLPETAQTRKLANEAAEFKLYDGIAVPIFRRMGGLVGMGFAGSEKDIRTDTDAISIINAAANQFWLAYSEIKGCDIEVYDEAIHLAPRENDVLCWTARGRTRREIADLLMISESAVKRYLEGAFKKLGVNNAALAVVKALRMGLISPY